MYITPFSWVLIACSLTVVLGPLGYLAYKNNRIRQRSQKARLQAGVQEESPLTEEEKKFIASLNNTLRPLDQKRLDLLAIYTRRLRISYILSVPTIILICIWVWNLLDIGHTHNYIEMLFFTSAFFVACFLIPVVIWKDQPKEKYKVLYKTELMPKIAELFGHLKYNPTGKIDMREMYPSKIIPSHHSYKSEDYIYGRHKDVDFKIADIWLRRKTKSGKRSTYVTTFRGIVIFMSWAQEKFHGHTIVKRSAIKGALPFVIPDGMKRADLVDPEFEKIFDVYTDDQVEARYLIHPAMVETIKSLPAAYDSDVIYLAYYERNILIMIPSLTDHFEHMDITVSSLQPVRIIKMKRQLEKLLLLIDELNIHRT
jgi:hypothetical protein